jgi:hypothetical protein
MSDAIATVPMMGQMRWQYANTMHRIVAVIVVTNAAMSFKIFPP